jgi:hypothetical protein
VARQLQSLGFEAAALKGGWEAWRAAQPVEPVRPAGRQQPGAAAED